MTYSREHLCAIMHNDAQGHQSNMCFPREQALPPKYFVWLGIPVHLQTCGHVTVSLYESFCLCGQQLPWAERAARAEPSLLELCRVAPEEDEVNNQQSPWNIIFRISKRKIPDRFLSITGDYWLKQTVACKLQTSCLWIVNPLFTTCKQGVYGA